MTPRRATCCLPTPPPAHGSRHVQGDVLQLIAAEPFDLMVAHPPCTYLTTAGFGWFNEERYGEKARERKRLREEGLKFFLALYNAPIGKVCVENPQGFVSTLFRPPNQYVHPYFFGEPFLKKTGLWLRGLPKLTPTNLLSRPEPVYVGIRKKGDHYKGGEEKKRYFVDTSRGGKNRWKERSTTFQGIADAMSEQWG